MEKNCKTKQKMLHVPRTGRRRNTLFDKLSTTGKHDTYWNTIYDKVPQLRTLSTTDQFIYIMTQEDTELTRLTLKTVREWMNLRTFLRENFYQQ